MYKYLHFHTLKPIKQDEVTEVFHPYILYSVLASLYTYFYMYPSLFNISSVSVYVGFCIFCYSEYIYHILPRTMSTVKK